MRVINGIHCRAYLPITAKWQDLIKVGNCRMVKDS